jgi:outer membrane protein, multidrug efflux system
MNSRIRSGACLLLAGVWGCAVGPNYKPPEMPVPERWSEAPTTAPATAPATTPASPPAQVDLARWWMTLNDSMLNSLVQRAIESNLNLQIAETRVLEARAQRGVVAAALWPQVNLGTSYSYSGGSQNAGPKLKSTGGSGVASAARTITITPGSGGAPPTITINTGGSGSSGQSQGSGGSLVERQQNLFQGGFDASWEIDVFGGTRRAVEAANDDIQAAEEGYRDVLVSLISEVALNYVNARGFQRRIAITEDNARSQEETVHLTESRQEAGFTSDLDVAQAQAQLTATRSQIPSLDSQFRQAVHHLGVLLGRDPGALLAELSATAPIPTVPPNVPAGVPSDILRRRPDIRRSERQLASATAQIGVATADLFPRFSLTGSFGTQTRDIQHFLDNRSGFWSIGPAISWPVFEGGRIVSNIELQNQFQREALLTYGSTVLNALEEVENSLVAYQQEQVRYRYLSESVDANTRAVQLATERYSRGVADFLTVLDSQRSLFVTQDQQVQSETTTVTSLISLYKALGGGWDVDATGSPYSP